MAANKFMPLVTLSSGKNFNAAQGVSILDAAMQAQVSLPYSCKTGRCSTCKCKVIQGETTALQTETGLSDAEKAEGWILSCVRGASTDVTLAADDLGGVILPQARTIPCRISQIDQLAPDVIRVLLRLPPAADFSFIPGQYVDLIGLGGIRRSYSLANSSFADKMLELHIRAVDGGAMSDYWFNRAKVDDLLRINGPLGTFFLRSTAKIDLILMATGTGIAPIKSMLESLVDISTEQQPRSITVLWGGRTTQDLYLAVNEIPGRHRFVPVLSRAGADWYGARGYVQQVLLNLLPDLNQAAVYACGSNAMIRSAKEVLTRAGLPPHHFYADAFVCSGTN